MPHTPVDETRENGILKSLHLIKPYIIENRTRIIIGLISLIIVDFLQLIIPRIIKTAVDDLTLYQASWEGLSGRRWPS
jgi:ATP-binding cassette subfamily B multidrug efflux pump